LEAIGKRYVVETYQNEKEWAIRYSDGWVEQGGESAVGIVSFHYEMRDTNYSANLTPITNGSGNNPRFFVSEFTTTNMRLSFINWGSAIGRWSIKGYGA
jgi:hypothetical protein